MFLSQAFRSNVNKRLRALYVVNSSHKSRRKKKIDTLLIPHQIYDLCFCGEWSLACMCRWKTCLRSYFNWCLIYILLYCLTGLIPHSGTVRENSALFLAKFLSQILLSDARKISYLTQFSEKLQSWVVAHKWNIISLNLHIIWLWETHYCWYVHSFLF